MADKKQTATTKPASTSTAAKPSKARSPRKPKTETPAETTAGVPVKPATPRGAPDPAPNENVDPVLRVRDPELAAAAVVTTDERYDLVGADGRTVVRNVSYQHAADEAARISGVTGEKLEIVATTTGQPAESK